MDCIKCKKPCPEPNPVAAISGSIMGDEHSDAFFWCPSCRVYTVSTCWDNFTGTETYSESGPLAEVQGKERVELISRCPHPWNKKCRCPAHLEYFGGTLD